MMRRVLKEFRILFWPWACALMIAPVCYILFDDDKILLYIPSGQIILCFIMSAASLGSEFENNTMERLLSQPISRQQLWHGKMGVLFICIEAAVFAYIAGFFLMENKISIPLKDFFFRARVIGPVYLCLNYYLPIQFAFLSSVCAGTLMALYLKKTHTAFWASITATALILVIWQFLLSICLSILGIKSLLYGEKAQEYGNAIQLGLPLFLWCIVSYFLARRKFMRMEV